MTGFAIGAAILVILSLVFLLWSFRRRPASADFSRQQLNAAIYRDQFAELDRDRGEGVLSQDDYDQARAELQRRLLEDSQAEAGRAAQAAPTDRATPIALALGLPLGAILLYLVLGNPAALNPVAHQQRLSQDDIERMVSGLAAKLEKEPENYQGWAMLARSYKSMGRFPEALRAYERTGPMLETSADLLVDYADAMAAANGFDAKVMAAIERAIKLDPAQPQALWMRGTAAFEVKQYAKAAADWERLLGLLEPGSEDARVVAANIDEAREKGGLGKAAPKVGAGGTASAGSAANMGTAKAAAVDAFIKGRVELAANLAGQAPADATMMVVARPNDGSRMPVAVIRARVGDLPLDFTLDDSLAMSPDRKLSQFAEIQVEARVSKTGQATPQAGDLFGPVQTVKLGARNVRLKIDQVRQ
jgi:cytochrome c-type biogenesis protein CcmH